jgi:MAF protein
LVEDPINILLASNSPRRRELMALGNWNVSSYVPEVDESRREREAPAGYVVRLARAKVDAASRAAGGKTFVVAADTVVVDGESLLGKPADAGEASAMLRRLRGHTHQVFTGLAVLEVTSGILLEDVCTTDVPMRDYPDAEIEVYAASGDPLDKAGAYAIQHAGFHPVEGLQGCFASVMGMPLCHLLRLLGRLRAAPPPDLPRGCQDHLEYACPVSDAILRGERVG